MSDFLPSDAKELLVRRLHEMRKRQSYIDGAYVKQVAAALGKSERTIWRWVAEGIPASVWPSYEITERDRELYYELRGNVTAVWRRKSKEDPHGCPSRVTLWRAFKAQMTPQERAYVVQGEQGWREHQVHLRVEVDSCNAVWEADHKELPIQVIPPGGTKPVKPWVTIFLDARSRAVMGYSINITQTAADVIAALQSAILPDDARGPFCGVPDVLSWDNGMEFVADSVTQVALAIGTLPKPTPAYSPHLKGKVERFNRTLEQAFLSGLPYYTEGAKKADGKTFYGGGERMSFELFKEHFEEFIRHYNLERPHSALEGKTPLEIWNEDPSPRRMLPREEVRWMLRPSKTRKILKDGIHFANHIFVAPELGGLVGEQVEIAFMPHDHRSIDVYYQGEFLTTAYPQSQLSAEDRQRLMAKRKADRNKAASTRRRVSRKEKIRLAPATEPGPAEVVTVINEEQARLEGRLRTSEDLRNYASIDDLVDGEELFGVVEEPAVETDA